MKWSTRGRSRLSQIHVAQASRLPEAGDWKLVVVANDTLCLPTQLKIEAIVAH